MRGYIRNGVTEPPGWCQMRTVTAAQDQLLKVPHQLQKVAESPGLRTAASRAPPLGTGSGRSSSRSAAARCSWSGLDNTIVNVGLPSIGRSLHANVAGLQWTVAGYTIVLARLLMLSGAVADRIGRRVIFQVGLSLFTLGSWLCSLAPSLDLAHRVPVAAGGRGGRCSTRPRWGSSPTRSPSQPSGPGPSGSWDAVFGLSMALGPVLGGILIGTVGLARHLLGQHPDRPGGHLADLAVRPRFARPEGAQV